MCVCFIGSLSCWREIVELGKPTVFPVHDREAWRAATVHSGQKSDGQTTEQPISLRAPTNTPGDDFYFPFLFSILYSFACINYSSIEWIVLFEFFKNLSFDIFYMSGNT